MPKLQYQSVDILFISILNTQNTQTVSNLQAESHAAQHSYKTLHRICRITQSFRHCLMSNTGSLYKYFLEPWSQSPII